MSPKWYKKFLLEVDFWKTSTLEPQMLVEPHDSISSVSKQSKQSKCSKQTRQSAKMLIMQKSTRFSWKMSSPRATQRRIFEGPRCGTYPTMGCTSSVKRTIHVVFDCTSSYKRHITKKMYSFRAPWLGKLAYWCSAWVPSRARCVLMKRT